MTRKLLTVLFFLSASLSGAEESGLYLGGSLGIYGSAKDFQEVETSYVKSRLNSSFANLSYGGMIGYQFNEFFRADINGQYIRFHYQASEDETLNLKQDIDSYAFFFNGYFSIPLQTVYSAYLTAGAGYVYNESCHLTAEDQVEPDLNYKALGKNMGSFAWNAGGGMRVKLYEHIDLDVSYRYTSLGKAGISAAKDARDRIIYPASQDIIVHQGILSLVYRF